METSGLAGAHDRRIAVTGTANLRDVGGYPAAGGGTVRWRTLLRSDALNHLGAPGRAQLGSLGLRTVVDLRTNGEVAAAPCVLDGHVVRACHVPLFSEAAIGRLPPELSAVYAHMIDRCGRAIARAIGQLCGDGALPGLIHCTAGKDRTGLVVALILEVIGVPDDVIAADYAMSSSHIDPGMAGDIQRIRAVSGTGRWIDLGALGSPPEVIYSALARVRQRSGSVPGYLLDNGLTRRDLEFLRTALVAPPIPALSAAREPAPPLFRTSPLWSRGSPTSRSFHRSNYGLTLCRL
jgi:protein-tyrosine phosphatase